MKKVIFFLLAVTLFASCNKQSSEQLVVSGHIVDVVNQQMFDGNIYVTNGVIDSIVPATVDANAPYIMPGFYDAHMHIESTLLLPEQVAKMAVRQGTIGIINDPHEIANVLGTNGVKYMLQSCAKTRFHFHSAASPCVPSTTFETSGCTLTADSLAELLDREDVYGLGEMMNLPGVLYQDSDIMRKIEMTLQRGKIVDGHITGVPEETFAAYFAHGISNNHECVSISEATNCLNNGAMVAIREGSAACNFDSLWSLLLCDTANLAFCTDDIYPDELQQGHINRMCARAVANGAPLWNVLRAACVTPVRHYHLNHGLLQQGDAADFIVVKDLVNFDVIATYIDGVLVAENGHETPDIMLSDEPISADYPNHFLAQPIGAEAIQVPARNAKIRVIGAHEGSLLTDMLIMDAKSEGGLLVSDTLRDILKVVSYSRHSVSQPAVGFIHGFAVKKGAIASTIGHDSHNIIALGADDQSIVKAVNRLIETQGGLVITDGDQVVDLALPIAGLMSPLAGDEVAQQYKELKAMSKQIGCTYNAPFMTMAFMSLPVIPNLKITDQGLFSFSTFDFTSLYVEE